MRRRRAVLAAALIALGACSGPVGDRPDGPPVASPAGPPLLYVAIGASETYGVGAEDPLRDAWPQRLFRSALPLGASFVNLGVSGATIQDALEQELPYAVRLEPDLVTVWLNVNDIIAGVPARVYGRRLNQMLTRLTTRGRTQVLVANTPPVELLPAYRACRRPSPGLQCPPDAGDGLAVPGPDRRVPGSQAVRAAVAGFNRVIAREARRTGATVVDLHSRALEAYRNGAYERLIAEDGFHPSSAGHRAVAEAFADALRDHGVLAD